MPLYTAYDEESDSYFQDLLTIKEYEDKPYLKHSSGRECPIIVNTSFSFRIGSKTSHGAQGTHAGHIIDRTPKTLGSLAESNAARFGADGIEARDYEDKQSIKKEKLKAHERLMRVNPKVGELDTSAYDTDGKYRVPWRDSLTPHMELNKMNAAEKAEYLESGKKPIGLSERSS